MASVVIPQSNGLANLPTHFEAATPTRSQSPKRKRDSSEPEPVNGVPVYKLSESKEKPSRDVQQQVLDLIEVLSSYDVSDSVLDKQMPSRDPADEPAAKRKKGEQLTSISTIRSRATSGYYASLDAVLSDVKSACTAVVADLDVPTASSRTQLYPVSPRASEQAGKVQLLSKKTEILVKQEHARDILRSLDDTSKPSRSPSLLNGTSDTNPATCFTPALSDSSLVLTLYGNAGTPGGKQLFSSLQEPVKTGDGQDILAQPLREAGLPNGINTTIVLPVQASGLQEAKPTTTTLGELHASSSFSLPVPKPSRSGITRSSTVGWYQPTNLLTRKSKDSSSYYAQPITSGKWLDYNGTSVDSKRKSRERPIGLGGSKPTSSDPAEVDGEKLEALFKNAYSSFAPSRDDSGAIIPEAQLNRIWWQKQGEKTFRRLVENFEDTPEPLDTNVETKPTDSTEIKDEFSTLDDSLDGLIDPSLEDKESQRIEDKEVEEILQGISELLETLDSFQRNRYLTLPSSSRQADAGNPAKPTESEIATYNTLKAQLTLMITMLPPYAVAKLNSDQLSDLAISTKLQISSSSHRGVMEEDEEAQRIKMAELARGTRTAQSPSTHRSSTSLYGNQYASSSRPVSTAATQYYGSQTPVRPPSAALRAPATAPGPYAPRPVTNANTTYRPQSTYNTPTYPHQLPRTSNAPYSPAAAQYYQNNASTHSYPQQQNYSGSAVSTSQLGLNARYTSSQTSYQQHQQRPASNGADYRYSNGIARQTSPQKPQYSPQNPSASLNRSYGTPTPSAAADRRYQPPVANGTTHYSPAAQVQSSSGLGATGYHTVMTPAEQATMMERQRAQLAQQQGTQQQARSAAQGAINGSSTPQTNGVTAT